MVSQLLCVVLLHIALSEVAGNVVLTSTVGENGRQFACDGELVTFTCQVVQSPSLQWQSPLTTPITFDFTSPQQSIPRPPFIITLTSIVGSGIMTNFTSILQVNASRTFAQSNTIVVCLDQLRVSEESNFTVAEIPATPLNFAVCQVERTSGGGSVTIMATWMRPQNYEQFDIDHYNLNVSSTSGIQQVSLQDSGDSTSAVLTVSENPNNVQLNTTFTVTITATSQCGETSSVATTNYTLIDCGPPAAPRNGSLESYTGTIEGSVVFYGCNPGFVPEIRMMSMCTGTGWSPNPGALSCSVVSCEVPTAPRNGSIEPYQSTLVGAEIFFVCAPGFVPSGRMKANCTSDGITVDGTWTPDPAALVCNASSVDCGDPNNASREVIVQYTSTRVGSVIFYQCLPGFAPSSLSAVCMESGRWSPDPSQVVCRMVTTAIPTVDCGPPTTPRNGSLESYTDTTEGSVVFYSCDPSQQWMRAVCTENGWSPNPADLNCLAGSISGSCSTSVAVTAVVSCAVSFIIGALVGAVVHYCAVRKKSKCHKFYSLTISQKQQPAPVYEDIVAQKGTVDPTHIELKENIAYGPVQN